MPAPVTPRAVLLDVYGTLVDVVTDEYAPVVWDALSRFAAYRGRTATGAELAAGFRVALKATARPAEEHPEYDVPAAFATLLGAGAGVDPVALAQLFRVLSIRVLRPFVDAAPALRSWRRRGLRIGFVSDAQRCFLEPELARTGLAPYADVLVVSSDVGYRKPDPRLFTAALDSLRLAPHEAIYVGDNPDRDVGGARAAGVPGVLLCRQCCHAGHLVAGEPARIVTSLARLLDPPAR